MSNCRLCGKNCYTFPLCKECNTKTKNSNHKTENELVNTFYNNRRNAKQTPKMKDAIIWTNKMIIMAHAINIIYDNSNYIDNIDYHIDNCELMRFYDAETIKNGIWEKWESPFASKYNETYNFNYTLPEDDMIQLFYNYRDLAINANTLYDAFKNTVLMSYVGSYIYNKFKNRQFVKEIYYHIELCALDRFEEKEEEEEEEEEETNDCRKLWKTEYLCSDGHYVRSLSEQVIDNWLYQNNYLHAYEKSIFMPTSPNETVLSDFYIPAGNVYLEFWGIENNAQYDERKDKKIKLYTENNINLINLYSKDIKHLDDILPKLLYPFIHK